MDDAERAFRDALRRVDAMPIPPAAQVAPAAPARRPLRQGPVRWLALAAAFALVGGLAAWAFAGRGGALPAVPAEVPSVGTTANPLLGTTWNATALFGRRTEPAPVKVPFVRFGPDGTYSGGDPCNGYGGTYTLGAGRLEFSLGPITEIACGGTQQELFHKAMEGTRRFDITSGTLELRDADGVLLAQFQSGDGGAGPTATPSAVPGPDDTTDPDRPVSGPPSSAQPTRPTPTATAGLVSVRIRNDSSTDFDDVRVTFGDGTLVSYGAIRAGETSEAGNGGPKVYAYARVELSASGRTYRLTPADYVGETPLEPGAYTYVLALVGGSLTLGLEVG